MTIPPVRRSITVPWPAEAAFRRFTVGIGEWWPHRTHSVGGPLVSAVVFEEGVGGKIYERHRDGRRFLWGTVQVWDPPRMVRFDWHPSRTPETAGDVEVTFTAVDGGTRVDLVHGGWERLGALGPRAAKGYNLGWRYVLSVWAERRDGFMLAMDVVAGVVRLAGRLRPRSGDPRDRAGGEIDPAA